MISPKHISMNDCIAFGKINLNHTYYFFKYIKNIDTNLLNINKTYAKDTNAVIYEIKYTMTQNINNQNVHKEIPPCLSFSDLDAYIIEENENKYLIFALTEDNKELLEPYKNFGVKLKKNLRQ